MPPHLLLSFLLGGIYGVLFHLWRGKSFQDLALYFLTGVIGFALGQAVANMMGLKFFMIGPLHLAEATLISWSSLFLAQWLKI